MANYKSVSISIEESLLDRISAWTKRYGGSRNTFVVEAIKSRLAGKGSDRSDVVPKEAQDTTERSLNEMMKKAMLSELRTRKDFMSNLSDEDLAKLVTSRLPKEADTETDFEKNILNLQKCLDGLSDVTDVMEELSKAKEKAEQFKAERDVQMALNEWKKDDGSMERLVKTIYGTVVEWIVTKVARRDLPGLNDGGGLSDKSLREVSLQVANIMGKFMVMEKGMYGNGDMKSERGSSGDVAVSEGGAISE